MGIGEGINFKANNDKNTGKTFKRKKRVILSFGFVQNVPLERAVFLLVSTEKFIVEKLQKYFFRISGP